MSHIVCEKCGIALGHTTTEALSIDDMLLRVEQAERERDALRAEVEELRVEAERAKRAYLGILARAEELGWKRPALRMDYFQSLLCWMTENAEAAREYKAKAQVCMDLHDSLGVPWGDDPYHKIGNLKESRDAVREETMMAFAAWLRDRAEQYDNGDGIRAAFDVLIHDTRNGEPLAAYDHGELDDILKRWRVRKKP